LANGDLTVLVTTAENLVYAGRLQEAARAYDAAATAARAEGDKSRAFDLALTAGAIDQRRGNLAGAIERYRKLAEAAPDHPKAPQTHLQAAWVTGQLHGKQSDRYCTLLSDHLKRWPDAKTADDARMWLGTALRELGQHEAAAELFRHVRPEATAHTEAVHQFYVCTLHVLRQLLADKKSPEEYARGAIEQFEQWITGNEKRWPERLTPAQREALIATASLRLEFLTGAEAAAELHLRAARKVADGATAAWQMQVRALLVSSLVRQEKFDAAKEELTNAPNLLRDRHKWSETRSDNPRLQQAYAEYLMALGDPSSLRSALERWRMAERRTQPGTPDWFRAKYWIARCHERLGDKRQAARVVTVLAGLHPELGGPDQKARFDALLKRCRP
jgi:tetratricopeptide (TPR) repeat protein